MFNISNFLNLITESAAASGKGKKTQQVAIMQQYLDETTRQMFEYIINPEHTFGVDKDMPIMHTAGTSTDGTDFMNLLSSLLVSEFDSRKERDIVIVDVLSHFSKEHQLILSNIIRNKARFGFGLPLLNNVLITKNMEPIRHHKYMKAKKLKTTDEYKALLDSGEFAIQCKYDGERTLVTFDPVIRFTASSGKTNNTSEYANPILQEELAYFDDWYFARYKQHPAIDCEKFAGKSFAETQNSKKAGANLSTLSLRVFFIMPQSDWDNKYTAITNAEVIALFDKFSSDYLEYTGQLLQFFTIVENHISHNYDEAMQIYQLYRDYNMEGAIIKKMTGTYEWNRSDQWIKLVPSISIDFLITKVVPADKGSKYEGLTGAFEGTGMDEAGRTIISSVGSGITEEMRKHSALHPNEYVGKIMECGAREYSKDETTGVWSVRFPSFNKLREK